MMTRPLSLLVCLSAALSGLAQSPAATPSPASSPDSVKRAELAAQALQTWYVPRTGLYQGTGWWNAANALTTIIDLMRVDGSREYVTTVANTFTNAQAVLPKAEQVGLLHDMTGAPGFLNTYYDDEGWWALAWINAYDLLQEPRYLAMAESIFADMANGWDLTCGGGIWWSKDRTYKNAIANELFFSVAAHLAQRAQPPAARHSYADWAAKEWSWFQRSGMINSDSLVNDGLNIDKASGICRNNGRTLWTYNQGVIVGALAEDSKTAHDPALLATAQHIADAALEHFGSNGGVLHESCEPNCGGDGVQFKGIFVRNLKALDASAPQPRYQSFLSTNAQAIWSSDRGPGYQLGLVWSGPFSSASAATQSSALDALVAAAKQP